MQVLLGEKLLFAGENKFNHRHNAITMGRGGGDGRGEAAAPHLTVEGVAGGGSARGILPAGRRGLVGSTHARQKYGAGSEAAQPRFGRPALREPRVGIYANDAGLHRPPVPNFSVRERFVLWAGGNSRCSAKHAEHA